MNTLQRFIRVFNIDKHSSVGERAVGFLWYHCRATGAQSASVDYLSQYFHSAELPVPSPQEISDALSNGNTGVTSAHKEGRFRLKFAIESAYDADYQDKVFNAGLPLFYLQYDIHNNVWLAVEAPAEKAEQRHAESPNISHVTNKRNDMNVEEGFVARVLEHAGKKALSRLNELDQKRLRDEIEWFLHKNLLKETDGRYEDGSIDLDNLSLASGGFDYLDQLRSVRQDQILQTLYDLNTLDPDRPVEIRDVSENLNMPLDAAQKAVQYLVDKHWVKTYSVGAQLVSITAEGIDHVQRQKPEELLPQRQTLSDAGHQSAGGGSDVFIVHGHDDTLKEQVARFVEKLGLKAIILHEQPNGGKTLIEKFEHHSINVGFAVVLLTPDDVGYAKKAPDKQYDRARQNVILELGYFIGKFGRELVCPLYRGDLELPNDLSGVVYVSVDAAGAWKIQLAKEMKEAGLDVDLNKVL